MMFYVYVTVLHTDRSYNSTISVTIPSSPLVPQVRFPALIGPEHTTRNCNEMRQIQQPQCLCLENMLERWEVDNKKLSNERPRDSVVEHLVFEDTNFASEYGFGGRATGECIEHVKEDEACEGHGGITRCDFIVNCHFPVVGRQCAKHDNGGRLQDTLDEFASEDTSVSRSRR